MPFAKINGVNLYYRIYSPKKKDWLVLVHAMSMSSEMWKEQVKEFRKHYKVLVYDQRGQGQSESSGGPFSIELFAADLKGLCDFLGIQHAKFLGLSMGGMVCQRFTLDHPEMVEKLVLCDTYHHVSDETDQFLLNWTEEMTKLWKGLMTIMTDETQFPRESEYKLYKKFKKMSDQVSKEDQLKLIRAVRSFDVSQHISDIKCPTLIISGEDEENFHKYQEDMHEKIKGSEMRIILGALHLTNMDKPDEFNKIVLEFLKKRG